MMRVLWTCPTCGHEAFGPDEVDHENEIGNGLSCAYEAKGDELQAGIEALKDSMEDR